MVQSCYGPTPGRVKRGAIDQMTDTDVQAAFPSFRVFTCGTFLVERRDVAAWQPVRLGEWGGSQDLRRLLKRFVCSPERHARRGTLLEDLWPDIDPKESGGYLNDAAYKLRAVLRPSNGKETLLITADDASSFRLPGQDRIWIDADAALILLEQAEAMKDKGADLLLLKEPVLSVPALPAFVILPSYQEHTLDIMQSRRQLLHDLLTLASTALVLSPYARLYPADGSEQPALSVVDTALDDLERITASYWRLCANTSLDLLGNVLEHLQTVTHLLKRAQPREVARRLCQLSGEIAGEIAQILGKTLFDLHEYALAWAYYTFSLKAAQAAFNHDLWVVGLGRMSLLLIYWEHPQEAFPLLQEASMNSSSPACREPPFTASDIVELYLHRGAFETALADEDQEQDPDRWASHTATGQECWQIVSQWLWNAPPGNWAISLVLIRCARRNLLLPSRLRAHRRSTRKLPHRDMDRRLWLSPGRLVASRGKTFLSSRMEHSAALPSRHWW
jgi:hypothetical protein